MKFVLSQIYCCRVKLNSVSIFSRTASTTGATIWSHRFNDRNDYLVTMVSVRWYGYLVVTTTPKIEITPDLA